MLILFLKSICVPLCQFMVNFIIRKWIPYSFIHLLQIILAILYLLHFHINFSFANFCKIKASCKLIGFILNLYIDSKRIVILKIGVFQEFQLKMVASRACVFESHSTVTDKKIVLNQLFPWGSAQRHQTETSLSMKEVYFRS